MPIHNSRLKKMPGDTGATSCARNGGRSANLSIALCLALLMVCACKEKKGTGDAWPDGGGKDSGIDAGRTDIPTENCAILPDLLTVTRASEDSPDTSVEPRVTFSTGKAKESPPAVVWKKEFAYGMMGSGGGPALTRDEKSIFVFTITGPVHAEGRLFEYDKDGNELHRGYGYPIEFFPVDAPVVDGNGIVFFIDEGESSQRLYAVKPNGLPWEDKWFLLIAEEPEQGLFPSLPALSKNGRIYIGTNRRGEIEAVDSSRGTVEWTVKTQGDVYTAPVIGKDGTIFGGSTDGFLYALAKNGTLKWKLRIGTPINERREWITLLAVASDGTIMAATGGARESSYTGGEKNSFNRIYAVDKAGKLKWCREARDNFSMTHGLILGEDDTIFTLGLDNHPNHSSQRPVLTHFSKNGDLHWAIFFHEKYSYETDYSAVIGSDGVVYASFTFGIRDGERMFRDFGALAAVTRDGMLKWVYEDEFDDLEGNVSRVSIAKDGRIYFSMGRYFYSMQTESRGLLNSSWPSQRHDSQNSGSAEE